MIKRENVLNLFGGRADSFHSAVWTCYNFDPIFFESAFLPVLRRLGVQNIIVLMDATIYDELLSDPDYSLHQVHQSGYTLVRYQNQLRGVFHPKVGLLVGQKDVVMVTGSGNLTFSGMSHNEEVWNAFHAHEEKSPNFPIVHAAWRMIDQLMGDAPTQPRKQWGWLREQCEWIAQECDDVSILTKNGETAQLVWNVPEQGIFDVLTGLIGDEKVEEITCIAPFYDTRGDAIKTLRKTFNPEQMCCVLALDRQSAPFELMRNDEETKYCKYTGGRPLHAKLLQLRTTQATWIVSGSANAGTKALGIGGHDSNNEAVVIMRGPRGHNYIKELGFDEMITPMSIEERKTLEKPCDTPSAPSTIEVHLLSCELMDDGLHLCCSEDEICANLEVLDSMQKVVKTEAITTNHNMVVPFDEEDSDCHMVVLRRNNIEISNRCLVVIESHVECCNPDPNRRKLSRLLDDPDLLNNLSHLLGMVSWEDVVKNEKNTNARHSVKQNIDNPDDEVVLTRDQYDNLKDNRMAIQLHGGLRIMDTLRKLFFENEKKDEDGDENMAAVKHADENESDDSEEPKLLEQQQKKEDESREMRHDITKYLSSMTEHLLDKMDDPSIQEHSPNSFLESWPKLIGEPGLNESTSWGIACVATATLMKKHGERLESVYDIRDALIDDSCIFMAIYGHRIPDSESSYRNRKIRETLKDASTMLLTSLSYFEFPVSKNPWLLPVTVLNVLDMWTLPEAKEVVENFNKQIGIHRNAVTNQKTVDLINEVAACYLKGDIPVLSLSHSLTHVYVYKKGYGFMMADHFTRVADGWEYTCHHPTLEEPDGIRSKALSKYRGFNESW